MGTVFLNCFAKSRQQNFSSLAACCTNFFLFLSWSTAEDVDQLTFSAVEISPCCCCRSVDGYGAKPYLTRYGPPALIKSKPSKDVAVSLTISISFSFHYLFLVHRFVRWKKIPTTTLSESSKYQNRLVAQKNNRKNVLRPPRCLSFIFTYRVFLLAQCARKRWRRRVSFDQK